MVRQMRHIAKSPHLNDMNYLIPAFFVLVFFFCCCELATNVPPTKTEAPYFTCKTADLFQGQTAKIIDSLVEKGSVMGSAVSVSGHKPEQYKRFERLMDAVSIIELEGLTEHEHPIVRSYGFRGMIERAHPKSFEIFLNLRHDTSLVSTMFGCTFDELTVGELAIQFLRSSLYQKSHYHLKPSEHIFLDSLLLFDPDFYRSESTLILRNIYPVEQHYQAFKDLALSDSVPEQLLVGLANYQKPEDLPIFLSSFDNRVFYDLGKIDLEVPLEITFRFPHTAFLPELRKAQQKMFADNDLSARHAIPFYLAIFRYSPEVIASFVNEIEKQPPSYIKDRHLVGIWSAAQLNTSPEKKAFIPSIEIDEWDSYILSYFRTNKRYFNLD